MYLFNHYLLSLYIQNTYNTEKFSCTMLHSLEVSPIPLPLATGSLVDVRSYSFASSRMSHKWNHIICSLWCLAAFTHHDVSET